MCIVDDHEYVAVNIDPLICLGVLYVGDTVTPTFWSGVHVTTISLMSQQMLNFWKKRENTIGSRFTSHHYLLSPH